MSSTAVFVTHAATIQVPSDHSSIQAAISAAADGDTVLVWPGVYSESKTIDFFGKDIRVVSESGPEETIIDGSSLGSTQEQAIVIFQSGETPSSILEGFTIRNADWNRRAGIYIESASPTIRRNVIVHNATGTFGGIYLRDSTALIEENYILENQGTLAGGISISGGSPSILRNAIVSNRSVSSGGTSGLWISGAALVKDNLIASEELT